MKLYIHKQNIENRIHELAHEVNDAHYLDNSKFVMVGILNGGFMVFTEFVKHALQYAKVVAYVDSDSVATRHVDGIFDYFPENNSYPYFVEGIYDWNTVYEMPRWLRQFTFNKIQDFYNKEAEAQENGILVSRCS